MFLRVSPGMGGHGHGHGHGHGGGGDGGSGFHSGHFVHMRGLPFRATDGDIAKVRAKKKKTLSSQPLKGDIVYHPGVSGASRYEPFWKSASSDITSGRVRLAVWRIDEHRLLHFTG